MPPFLREDIPAWLIGAAAVCSVVSIAAMEILMGAAVVAFLATWRPIRLPRIWIPFAAFTVLTLISWIASGHIREGLPLIKKFYLYIMLFLIPIAFRSARQVLWVVLGWALAASLSSAWALNQFYNKFEDAKEAHLDFYHAYVADRITGFMDHWETFSGGMMMALLMVAAFLFFSKWRRANALLVAAGALISIAIIAAETRGVWAAAGAGGVYLIWFWRRWMLIAIPVLIAIIMLTNPFQIGDRVSSAFHPHGDLDSNQHRAITRAIGWRMMAAHPWLGIGPEQVKHRYMEYLPPGTPLPLPPGYYEHLHNNFIHYGAELGVPAAVALMAMFFVALWDFAKALRRAASPETRWILHGAIAVIIAMMVAGYFEKTFGDSEVMTMFLAVIGCGYVAVREIHECRG
jgi:O-antigen ligase